MADDGAPQFPFIPVFPTKPRAAARRRILPTRLRFYSPPRNARRYSRDGRMARYQSASPSGGLPRRQRHDPPALTVEMLELLIQAQNNQLNLPDDQVNQPAPVAGIERYDPDDRDMIPGYRSDSPDHLPPLVPRHPTPDPLVPEDHIPHNDDQYADDDQYDGDEEQFEDDVVVDEEDLGDDGMDEEDDGDDPRDIDWVANLGDGDEEKEEDHIMDPADVVEEPYEDENEMVDDDEMETDEEEFSYSQDPDYHP